MTRARLGSLLASAALAVLALALMEAALSLFGPPARSRLPYQQLRLPAVKAVGGVLATTDPRMAYQEVPDGSGPLVVVFGGSAAAGLGHSPNAAFARHLERLLQRDERCGPGR